MKLAILGPSTDKVPPSVIKVLIEPLFQDEVREIRVHKRPAGAVQQMVSAICRSNSTAILQRAWRAGEASNNGRSIPAMTEKEFITFFADVDYILATPGIDGSQAGRLLACVLERNPAVIVYGLVYYPRYGYRLIER